MTLTPKTIVYGSVAIVVLYMLAKREAITVVTDVYKPVKETSSSFGSWLADITHPLRHQDSVTYPDGKTVNDARP